MFGDRPPYCLTWWKRQNPSTTDLVQTSESLFGFEVCVLLFCRQTLVHVFLIDLFLLLFFLSFFLGFFYSSVPFGAKRPRMHLIGSLLYSSGERVEDNAMLFVLRGEEIRDKTSR